MSHPSRSPAWTHFLWPAATFAAALALYLATMAQVHRGDTVGLLLETRQGLAHDPAHLLVRPLLGLSLAAGQALAPALSPWSVLAGVAALAGALVAACMTLWLLRRGVSPGLAVLAAALASLSSSGWLLSTTFEAHGLPLAALLGLAIALDRSPLAPARAALGGALLGLAVAFHVIAAPVGLAWVALLALADRPWRARLGSVALVLGAAALVLQAGHVLTFFGPDGGGPPTSWLYPVALVEQSRQLAGTEALARVPLEALPGAVAAGLARGAVSTPRVPWAWTGLLLAILAVAGVRARPLGRRYGPPALVPAAWVIASLPLAAWVGPHNYEYYRGTWVAAALLAALVAWDLLAGRRRPVRLGALALGATAALGLLFANRGAISADMHSPTGAPVGLMDRPPWTHDGHGGSQAPSPGPPPRR